ncbi:MAG: hypothetical protein ACYDD6_01380 [Acidimicrobiales bacterium]
MVEILTFKLAPDTDEATFLAADRRVQTEFIPNRAGFLRRTTARGSDGEWIVATLWASEPAATSSAAAGVDHPAVSAFMTLLDATAVRVQRYVTLD